MTASLYMPKQIVSDITTAHLRAMLSPSVAIAVTDITVQDGYRIYVTRQTRGFCNWREKVITIPMWALLKDKKAKGYADWYVSHEIAHAITGYMPDKGTDYHGPEFMANLKSICPVEAQVYEITYKPRHALAAGVALNFEF